MLYDNEDGSWSFTSRGCGCCSNYYKFYENPTEDDEWDDSLEVGHVIEYLAELEEQTKRANELLKLMEAKAERTMKEKCPNENK